MWYHIRVSAGTVPADGENRKENEMARTSRLKADGDAYYHVTSRITGQQYLLAKAEVKRAMLDVLERSAAFSGVNIAGFCIMDDHFHVLCQVPKLDAGTVPDDVVLERVGRLCGERRLGRLKDELDAFAKAGDLEAISAKLDRFRARMYDISEFVKTFLEMFRIRFDRIKEYKGRLWCERFNSVLIEDGKQLQRCKKYIELNPVRAGMTGTIVAYAWNTEGAANAGNAFAKACLAWFASIICGDSPHEEWMLKRCAQVASGKILGGKAYVIAMIGCFADQLMSRSLMARPVADGVYASHGYRLAKKA